MTIRGSFGPAAARAAVWGLVLAVLAGAGPLEGATLLQLEDLENLVDESRTALLGRVVDVQYGYDERRLHSTWVTLEVEDPVYGEKLPERGLRYTFKTYGAPVPMLDGTRLFVDGTPLYRRGERYLLLLIPVSEWGFSDAAGLFQGVFRVSERVDGRLLAESLAGNHVVLGERGLGRWIDPEEVGAEERPFLGPVRGPVPYSLLRRAIARMKGVPELPDDGAARDRRADPAAGAR